jgi:hypothetical protein
MKVDWANLIRRMFTTPYRPQPASGTFMARAQSQESPAAQVTVAVADPAESERIFGVPLSRKGVQPVFLRIVNRSHSQLRLHLVSIDPSYYTPLEAAALNHFSIVRRLSAFGFVAWIVALPILLLIPFKVITARRANRRMDDLFQSLAFHLRPIPPGGTSEGFVFTALDLGTKVVHVRLFATGEALDVAKLMAMASQIRNPTAESSGESKIEAPVAADFTFSIPVPGITADYLRRDFETLIAPESMVHCHLPTFIERLREMPAATVNEKMTGSGDPVNLVVVGSLEMVMSAFLARWDESETITLKTCWKTTRAFVMGSQYRYSPVSPLYLFGRSQDIALQRSRRSINERLHLRLWLTPLRFLDRPVWIGQISRDIGVRFTTKTWNLTTHRIDPDVDESRDYVVEDLLQAERVHAVGYLDGVGPCDAADARHNLTGDPYFTDGKRAVVVLSSSRMKPRFVAW